MTAGNTKINVEIYEGDPFGSTCCGPGPRMTSLAAVEKLRKMLVERSEIVNKISEKYGDCVTVKRDMINQKRQDYPEYVVRLMLDDKPAPYVFIDGELAVIGEFPSYERFTALLDAYLKQKQI